MCWLQTQGKYIYGLFPLIRFKQVFACSLCLRRIPFSKRIKGVILTKVFHSLSHGRTQSFVKTLRKNNSLSAFVHIGWFLPFLQKEERLILQDPVAECVRKIFQVGYEYIVTCKLSRAIWSSALNFISIDPFGGNRTDCLRLQGRHTLLGSGLVEPSPVEDFSLMDSFPRLLRIRFLFTRGIENSVPL